MDLFGMEGQWNQQQNQMLSNVGFFQAQRPKATLYLFSRRFMPDQMRRPFLYNFNGEFRNELQVNLARAVNQNQPIAPMAAMLPNVNSARTSILPSATGQPVNLTSFSDAWTFILILDNDFAKSPLGIASTVPNRLLYSGWIVDEPVTPTNMSAGYTPNPSAMFNTTHHVTLAAHNSYSQFGSKNYVDAVGDFDYVNGLTAMNTTMDGQSLVNAMPSNILNSLVIDPDDYHGVFNFHMPSIAENSQASVELPTEMNSPTHHLQTLVTGFTDAVKLSNAEMQDQLGQIDLFGGPDVFVSNLATVMRAPVNSTQNDLDPKVPFFFSQLIQKFGNELDIVVLNIPWESQVGLSSPMAPTKRNVLTSVITGALPGLMTQFGICEIAFRYNSYQPVVGGLGSTNGDRGVWQILNVGTLYPVGQDTLAQSVERLQMYLKLTVFPILLAHGGHFDLTVHCSTSGVCLVDLQLKDEMIEPGLVESNNLLGGLNSPLISPLNYADQNARQLMNVVQDTRASGTPEGEPSGLLPPMTLPLF